MRTFQIISIVTLAFFVYLFSLVLLGATQQKSLPQNVVRIVPMSEIGLQPVPSPRPLFPSETSAWTQLRRATNPVFTNRHFDIAYSSHDNAFYVQKKSEYADRFIQAFLTKHTNGDLLQLSREYEIFIETPNSVLETIANKQTK